MTIKTMELADLKPAPYNPRKDLQPGDPEYEAIKRSIEEFGLVDPLIWNQRTGNLVGGHQRLKVLLASGVEQAEVSVVDMDEAREKALNVALNKLTGAWDIPALKDLLIELDTGSFDMDLTGFNLHEIKALMYGESLNPSPQPTTRLDIKKHIICPKCGHEFQG